MHANNYLHHRSVVIREMDLNDLPMVVGLVELCPDPDGWSPSIFNDCLAAGYPSFVVEENGYVCGFIVASIAIDELQILNLGVHPEYRKRGIASSLLNACIQLAKAKNCCRLTLEVRLSNIPAQKLYEKFSFVKDGYRKDYYSALNATREDALLYSLNLN